MRIRDTGRALGPHGLHALLLFCLLAAVPVRAAQESAPTKSPRGAMVRSVLLPGWGQVYTGHPWRGVAVCSVEAALLAMTWRERRAADREFEAWERTADAASLDEYDRRMGRADEILGFAIGVFLLNIADAYVSAHLYDFESRVSRSRRTGRTQVAVAVPIGRESSIRDGEGGGRR